MKRRNFIRGLVALPAMSMIPTLTHANGNNNNGSNVTGLNRIIEIIQNDTRLNRRVDASDIITATNSAKRMNDIIIEAIIQTGIGNDKKISTADTREINDYIFHNHHDEWTELYGYDEDDEETGFHLVLGQGARTRLFGRNAINKVAASIYCLGFEPDFKYRLSDENGDKSARYKQVAIWLETLLKEDLEASRLLNPNIHEVVGESGTGLDKVVEIIYSDSGLQKQISTGSMRVGARSANVMNALLLEAITQTNAGSSGEFTTDDMRQVNRYLVANHASAWQTAHGSDEDDDAEQGYHKVQYNGAKTRLYESNAINRVFGGVYHLGFETPYENMLVDEEGEEDITFKRVAQWLSKLLKDYLNNQKEDLKILIPLYSYPNWYASGYPWKKIIDIKAKYPDIDIVAIVNPNNGNFTAANSDYTRGISDLIKANIKVIGYVPTDYGNRDVQLAVNNIEAWKTFYKEEGVSGIFFDETPTDINMLDYYTTLTNEARSRGFDFTILNPGVTTNQHYIDSGIASLVVTYENSYDLLTNHPPLAYNKPTKKTEISLLIHTMESNNVDNLITFARAHEFGYIYFTEDVLGNPWDTVSKYFEVEVVGALK